MVCSSFFFFFFPLNLIVQFNRAISFLFFLSEGSRAVALDVLKVLVQYSPMPLSNTLVETAFPTACHCILNSEDHATLQSGGELIRTYLSVAAQQIITHRDNEGQTGLQYILQIIAQLLNPQVTLPSYPPAYLICRKIRYPH